VSENGAVAATVVLPTQATEDQGLREHLYSWFAQKGFRVEGGFANSFAIAAPLETFDAVFGTRLSSQVAESESRSRSEQYDIELPLTALPLRLRESVAYIGFGRPPDFGPTAV
jgi:hypothetical protein